MRLYTKTGDSGETGLLGGSRVWKDHTRVQAYGDVDELNAVLGWCVVSIEDEAWRDQLARVQDRLFVLGAQLASPDAACKAPVIAEQDVAALEGWIDAATEQVDPLKHFVLPGGCESACRFHLARTVCRRAERSTVHLARETRLASEAMTYLNRLADLLFAWARLANKRSGTAEVLWHPPR